MNEQSRVRKTLVTLITFNIILFSSVLNAKNIENKYFEISKDKYQDQIEGFWLAQSIANWTGLITEMDKVKAPFYTDADWGKPDQKAIWGEYVPHANRIDFYFVEQGEPWGADDDTDIEYLYLHLLDQHQTAFLTAEQIRKGWLKHTYSNEDAPLYKKFPDSEPQKENFLWVSNDRARELMVKGMLPPKTSLPDHNPYYMMIDAQLTTEMFGILAPCRPDIAKTMAELPIRVTAYGEAYEIAQFYVVMHALAACPDKNSTKNNFLFNIAEKASTELDKKNYPYVMYQFIKSSYLNNEDKDDWEKTRDEVYEVFQLNPDSGYHYKDPFEAGINFAASLISLFYGEGDIKKTIRIGSLMGWDSDNPTATWGGLLGFVMGKKAVEKAFQHENLSSTFWIHRTRRQFPDRTPVLEGEDTFSLMALRSMGIVELLIKGKLQGRINNQNNSWQIPYK